MPGFNAQFQIKFEIAENEPRIYLYVEQWNQSNSPADLSFRFWHEEAKSEPRLASYNEFISIFTSRCKPDDDCWIETAQNPSYFAAHVNGDGMHS